MSRRAIPTDNAYAESFIKTLKYEEVHLNEYDTLSEAQSLASITSGRGVQREALAFSSGLSAPCPSSRQALAQSTPP